MTCIAGTTREVSFTPPHSVNADGNANAIAAHARIEIPNRCSRSNRTITPFTLLFLSAISLFSDTYLRRRIHSLKNGLVNLQPDAPR